MYHVSCMCDGVQSQNIVPKIINLCSKFVWFCKTALKNQKPMILMEFIKNIVTICFAIPKSGQKVDYLSLIFRFSITALKLI